MSLGHGPQIVILASEKMCLLGTGQLTAVVDPGWREKKKSSPHSWWNCFHSGDLPFVFSLRPESAGFFVFVCFYYHLVKQNNKHLNFWFKFFV
jgi:hypothetical protein